MKKLPLAAAILAAFSSFAALASETGLKATDILTQGWEVHGYASMNYRLNNGQSLDSEFGKPDYKTAGTFAQSSAQVEFVVKKHDEYANGVTSDFIVRAEYGNGDSYYYSSPGSQKLNDTGQFEIKEAYVAIGNLPYLPAYSEIWAGRRYLNRAAGALSGEFWKQSSGSGAGFEMPFNQYERGGFAVVSADPEAGAYSFICANGENVGSATCDTIVPSTLADGERTTVTSYDFYYYGVPAFGGSLDFDLKIMRRASQDPLVEGNSAERGVGVSITYNRDFYGFDGWSQTGLAYGTGLAANRGVNFGSWSTLVDTDEALFFTSYGVANVGSRWQIGTELTWFQAFDTLFGAKGLERGIAAVRPSYKVNDNFRLEFTGSYGYENGDAGYWGRTGDAIKSEIYNAEIASVFTVNSDYFGRPQIKPYVSYIRADDVTSAQIIGIQNGKDETIVGVHAEIWF